jgi:hypothetical protein
MISLAFPETQREKIPHRRTEPNNTIWRSRNPKDRNKTRYDEITIKREERNDEETTKAELSTVPLQLSAGQVGWLTGKCCWWWWCLVLGLMGNG